MIFIEDSADYPDYIYDIYIPYQDVSSGLWGYCDVDGKILKDAKYAVALGFYDNVAFVCDDKSGEYYLINKNFEPISDKSMTMHLISQTEQHRLWMILEFIQ